MHKQAVPTASSGSISNVIHTLHIEPTEWSITATVLNNRKAIVIEDTSQSSYIGTRLSAKLNSKSLLALPLIADEHKLGAALITFQEQHFFTTDEINFGEQAASQIALAIAKSRALEDAQHRAQELYALQNATAALLTTLDLERLLGQILDAAMSANPSADKGALHLIVPETGQLHIRAAQGYTDPRIRSFQPTSSDSFTTKAVHQRRPLLINDVHMDTSAHPAGDFPEAHDISSMIIAPLILGEKVLGAIVLGSFRRYAFTESNLRLLVSFAATATTAIQNARLHGEVQKQAVTDTLTGLYNRRGLFELGQREVMRSLRFQRPLTAILFDIDHFKHINDTYGHLVGDQILAGVSSQCLTELRQVDLLGRYGGDEFLALLPETELANAILVAERLREKVAELFFPAEDEIIKVTLSAGVASLIDQDTLDTLIERTDQALYRAKEGGKNRVEIPED